MATPTELGLRVIGIIIFIQARPPTLIIATNSQRKTVRGIIRKKLLIFYVY